MASTDETVSSLLDIIPVAATTSVAGHAFKLFTPTKKSKKSKDGFSFL